MIAYATLGVMLRKLAGGGEFAPPGPDIQTPEQQFDPTVMAGQDRPAPARHMGVSQLGGFSAPTSVDDPAPEWQQPQQVGSIPNLPAGRTGSHGRRVTPQNWYAKPRFAQNTGEHARWTAPAGEGPAREVSWLPPVRDGRFQARMSGKVHNADPNNWKSKPGSLDMTTPEMQQQFAKLKADSAAARAAGSTDPYGLTPAANKARWDAQRPVTYQQDVTPGSGQAWSSNKTTQPAQVNGKGFGFGGTNAQNAAFQDRMALLQKAGPNWRQLAAEWKKPKQQGLGVDPTQASTANLGGPVAGNQIAQPVTFGSAPAGTAKPAATPNLAVNPLVKLPV